MQYEHLQILEPRQILEPGVANDDERKVLATVDRHEQEVLGEDVDTLPGGGQWYPR